MINKIAFQVGFECGLQVAALEKSAAMTVNRRRLLMHTAVHGTALGLVGAAAVAAKRHHDRKKN